MNTEKAIVDPDLKRMPVWGHILCFVLAATTLGAAVWQHERAVLKDQMQTAADAQLAKRPLAAAELLSASADKLAWRRAQAVGTLDAEQQFLVDNRVHNGRAGFHVIAPMQIALEPPRWLLINLGWFAAPADRAEVAIPPLGYAADEQISITGTLVAGSSGALTLRGPQIEGVIWQNLDIERWTELTGNDAVAAVLLAEESDTDDLAAATAEPDFRAERSRGYRLQWLMLFLVIVVGWVKVTRKMKSGEA